MRGIICTFSNKTINKYGNIVLNRICTDMKSGIELRSKQIHHR